MAGLYQASAISVSIPSSLNGNYAYYTSGVGINLSADQQFSSMTISFNNIQLRSAPQGYLYVDLLDHNAPGLSPWGGAKWDGDQPGDYFSSYLKNGQGISLAVEQYYYWFQSKDFSITLNSDQLAALNAYGQNGIFDIGLDPDCFFNNYGSCTITYQCQPKPHCSVPDNGWTVALLGVPFLGLMLMRRRLAWK